MRKFSLRHLLKSIVWAFQKSAGIPDSTFVARATARAKLPIFVILKRNRGVALRANHVHLQSTRPQMCLSRLKLCIRVGKIPSERPKLTEITS